MAESNSSEKGRHILVLGFPFGNHATPLLTLVCKLAEATPDTLFSFFNTEKSNASIFSDPISKGIPVNIKAHNVPDGVPKDRVLSGNPLEAVDIFLKAAPQYFKESIDKVAAETEDSRRISCLITDGFLAFAGEIAESFNVPWIPVWLPLPCALSAHVYTDQIRQLIYAVEADAADQLWREHKKLDMIPGLSKMRIADLPDEVTSSESVFASTLSKLGHVVSKPSAVVMNFYQELNAAPLNNDIKSKFRKVFNIGFLSLSLPLQPLPAGASDSDATGCLSWLDKKQATSVAYISFGTVVVPPPKELVALAEALEEIGIPFLWSLRDNLKHLLPNGFVERTSNNTQGKIVPWVPQTQVLRHPSIGVFVTHCGCNSVYESIATGVPMICRPFFGDHKMTGRMVEDVWGIGVSIEGGVFTRSGVLNSLKIVLTTEQGKKMRDEGKKYKEILAEAAGPSGSAVEDFRALVDLISLN